MAFGGIPPYLQSVHRGNSVTLSIESACYSKDGLLSGEFNNLYGSLFDIADHHIKVVRALPSASKGLQDRRSLTNADLALVEGLR